MPGLFWKEIPSEDANQIEPGPAKLQVVQVQYLSLNSTFGLLYTLSHIIQFIKYTLKIYFTSERTQSYCPFIQQRRFCFIFLFIYLQGYYWRNNEPNNSNDQTPTINNLLPLIIGGSNRLIQPPINGGTYCISKPPNIDGILNLIKSIRHQCTIQ